MPKSIYPVFPIFLLLSFMVNGQSIEPEDTLNNKLISAAREIINAASTCALITLDEEGRPRVRAMDAFSPESDFTVWFGTNPKSRKVGQIRNDPRVTLYYINQESSGYVMIHGKAKLVDDPKEKEKRWKEEWKTFYPNWPEGYLLIKVSPEWMEVVSYPHGIIGDSITWEPPAKSFKAKQ